MRALDNAALDRHAAPVLQVLEECRAGLLDASEDRDGVKGRVPGLAFKIARATKVCSDELHIQRCQGARRVDGERG